MNKCLKCGKNCEKEYCFRCKPTAKLPSHTTLKRGKLMVNSNKKKENVDNVQQMQQFFLSIWSKRKTHKCEMCGQGLGNDPLSYMFDHILEKSIYPELKFEEDNIAYLCLLCHDNKTRGFPSESYLQKINETKIKYNLK